MTVRLRALRSRNGQVGPYYWRLGTTDYAVPTRESGSGDEVEPVFHMDPALVDVQCMCGGRFLKVKIAVFRSENFNGVECEPGCRKRSVLLGVVDRPRGWQGGR